MNCNEFLHLLLNMVGNDTLATKKTVHQNSNYFSLVPVSSRPVAVLVDVVLVVQLVWVVLVGLPGLVVFSVQILINDCDSLQTQIQIQYTERESHLKESHQPKPQSKTQI